jgi:hypothetical protein
MKTKGVVTQPPTVQSGTWLPKPPARPLLLSLALTVLVGCADTPVPLAPSAVAPSLNGADVIHHLQNTGSARCSYGDAQALFNAIEVANETLLRSGLGHPWAQTLVRCQYRLFWEDGHPVLGQPVTFSEGDHFLGGVVAFIPYKLLGISRADAIAILEAIHVRTWLAEVTANGVGDLVERSLMESAIHNTMTAGFGLIVSRQWGFIDQLPAGEYVSFTEAVAPVFFELEEFWTVPLTITSSTYAIDSSP